MLPILRHLLDPAHDVNENIYDFVFDVFSIELQQFRYDPLVVGALSLLHLFELLRHLALRYIRDVVQRILPARRNGIEELACIGIEGLIELCECVCDVKPILFISQFAAHKLPIRTDAFLVRVFSKRFKSQNCSRIFCTLMVLRAFSMTFVSFWMSLEKSAFSCFEPVLRASFL